MNNYGKPNNTNEMQWQTEVQILGLVKRLKEYSRQPQNREIFGDLDMAANLLNEFLRSSDDFK